MAVSLAFGVIFATLITLVLVPTAYLIIEDLRWGGRSVLRLLTPTLAKLDQVS